jgi:hypothetical protein
MKPKKKYCHECKKEIKRGDGWERHGRLLYCSGCADRINASQHKTAKTEDRRYP